MIIWCMHIACWLPRATETHSQYVILIARPLQQRSHERVSMLRCTLLLFRKVCIVLEHPGGSRWVETCRNIGRGGSTFDSRSCMLGLLLYTAF